MKLDYNWGDGLWVWVDCENGTTYHIHVDLARWHICIGEQRQEWTSVKYYWGEHQERFEIDVEK